MEIKDFLKSFGLNKNQSKVYLTILQLGSSTIQELANKSNTKRTTVYSVLDVLIKNGLVTFYQKGQNRIYSAEDPKKIATNLENQIQKIKQTKSDFEDILPELRTVFNTSLSKPKIKFYEGEDGIREVYEETLELKRGEEILAYASAEQIYKYMHKSFVKDYLPKRIEKGILQRALVEDSGLGRAHQKNDKSELRKTRLVSQKKFPFSNEINIFKNKMFIASFKELFAVVIESKDIADMQRAIFELAWLGAKKQD